MADRTEYQREYKRRQRAADPERARAESREAYERLKAREAASPRLKILRVKKAQEWKERNRERLAEQARRRYDRIRVHPPGLLACRRLAKAVTGTLNPSPCPCGEEQVEMHGASWMCRPCHEAEHTGKEEPMGKKKGRKRKPTYGRGR